MALVIHMELAFLNIKDKQFLVTGYSSNIAQEAIDPYSKKNLIYGTFNQNDPGPRLKNIKTSRLNLQKEDKQCFKEITFGESQGFIKVSHQNYENIVEIRNFIRNQRRR